MTINRPSLQIGQDERSGRLVSAGSWESAGQELADGEQSAALLQVSCADAIGQEAELADADQSGRQHVEQEAADELDRVQGHGLVRL